jgi:hypothetical protein
LRISSYYNLIDDLKTKLLRTAITASILLRPLLGFLAPNNDLSQLLLMTSLAAIPALMALIAMFGVREYHVPLLAKSATSLLFSRKSLMFTGETLLTWLSFQVTPIFAITLCSPSINSTFLSMRSLASVSNILLEVIPLRLGPYLYHCNFSIDQLSKNRANAGKLLLLISIASIYIVLVAFASSIVLKTLFFPSKYLIPVVPLFLICLSFCPQLWDRLLTETLRVQRDAKGLFMSSFVSLLSFPAFLILLSLSPSLQMLSLIVLIGAFVPLIFKTKVLFSRPSCIS